jgi:A/G-specific adenine glycosylase
MKQEEEIKQEDVICIDDILGYYKKSGRHDLVWRKNITPYSILVSEVMLQQTQVSRVLSKYQVWMKHYPTLTALGKSSLTEVLVLWQGLGYQRRAKALLAVAKEHSKLPTSYEELLTLPGIGRYTASAICAFAYDTLSHPVLETNIRTVLIEYFHQGEEEIHDGVLYDDLTRLENYKKVKKLGARHFYYAIMDYGAYLKSQKISHNKKSKHHVVQSAYKGSQRELRAKVLFAITHKEALPKDERLEIVLSELLKEGFIIQKGKKYLIA